jgi:hypothetical protein
MVFGNKGGMGRCESVETTLILGTVDTHGFVRKEQFKLEHY